MSRLSPHMEALAFQLWQAAEPRGWDLTMVELSELTGIHPAVIGRIAKAKGWRNRFRAGTAEVEASILLDGPWLLAGSGSVPTMAPNPRGLQPWWRGRGHA